MTAIPLAEVIILQHGVFLSCFSDACYLAEVTALDGGSFTKIESGLSKIRIDLFNHFQGRPTFILFIVLT